MIIKNSTVTDPASGTSLRTDLLIRDGIIADMGNGFIPQEGEELIDGTGLTAAPGLIDTHVHFRDPGFPHKETLHTGALAAARGGFTTVICMANTSPVADTPEVLQDILTRAQKENIRILQACSVSKGLKGEEFSPFADLKASGACGFTDDGIPLKDAAFLYHAMEEAARLNVPISLHEEDPSFIKNNGINHGTVSDKLGIFGSPSIAEESLVARDCMLALRTGARTVIQHISSRYSVELVRTFRSLGADIHAEATPHHFTLTEEAVLEHGTLAKMNPPLRTEEDRMAIIRGLADGTIDIIATDHAPHSTEEKSRSITAAPSGIIGLETALALGITSLVRPGHLSLNGLLEKLTINPAILYGLPSGRIKKGAPADIILFDPEEKWTVNKFFSRSSNSPFTGWEVYGKIKRTICRGVTVYQDDKEANE